MSDTDRRRRSRQAFVLTCIIEEQGGCTTERRASRKPDRATSRMLSLELIVIRGIILQKRSVQ